MSTIAPAAETMPTNRAELIAQLETNGTAVVLNAHLGEAYTYDFKNHTLSRRRINPAHRRDIWVDDVEHAARFLIESNGLDW